MRIVIRHRRITAIRQRVITYCSNGTREVSGYDESRFHIPIRHDQFVLGYRFEDEGWDVRHLTGKISPDRIVGTYFESVDVSEGRGYYYTCATGPLHHRGPIHYVAHLVVAR
jgi:hypothetical protein